MEEKTKLNDNEQYMFMYGYCYRMAEEMQFHGNYKGMETVEAMKLMITEIINNMEDKNEK